MLLSPAQLAAGDVLFVLTIEWAGRAWRWSSAPADITWTRTDGAAAEALLLDGGLDQSSIDRSLAAISDAPDYRSVSVEVLWPEDIAGLIADGHDLATGVGEIAMLTPGMDWAERVVLISGLVSQPEYGGDGEPVALSIVEEAGEDVGTMLAPTAIVTMEKFPTALAGAEGKFYPVPIGTPGFRVDRGGTSHFDAGCPALCIESSSGNADTLLVCAGRAAATTILIVYPDDTDTWSASGALSIAYDTDPDGNVYGYVDVSGESPDLRGAGSWYSCWNNGGGVLASAQSGAVLTLGQAMLWAAMRSAIRIDIARWQGVADRLSWPIAGYIDEQCSPMDWISDNLLPLAPVAMTWGFGGLGPVLWQYEARRAAAVRTIRAGEGYHRVGRVTYEKKPRDIVNRLTMKWAREAIGGRFLESTTLTPDLARDPALAGGELAGVRQGSTLDSMRSRSMYRAIRAEEHESDLVWSSATAFRAMHWRTRAAAMSPRKVEYDCDTEVLEIEEGDVVVLVDDELSLDVVAQVGVITISDTPKLRVLFRILDPATSLPLETPPYATEDDPRYGEGQ